MAKARSLIGIVLGFLAVSAAIAGGAFYFFVLPKLHVAPAPKPIEPARPEARLVLDPKRKTTLLEIPPLPGTVAVRVALDSSNAHLAWALANLGRATEPSSLFARYGVTAALIPADAPTSRIAALRALAEDLKRKRSGPADEERPADLAGAQLVTVSADESRWLLDRMNRALSEVDPAFSVEVVGISGLSSGEAILVGPPAWRTRPRAAAGGVVAAVPGDDGWGVLAFWCAENGIPINLDQEYYDPAAVNVVESESSTAAVESYVEEETAERIFLAEGADHRGWEIRKGETGTVAISGIATRAAASDRIASERSGAVTIASTKRYPSQGARLVVGLKQWNAEHREVVVHVLASLFAASQQLDVSDRELRAGRIAAKSPEDARWRAAQVVRDLFAAGSAESWYDHSDGAEHRDEDGGVMEIGGAAVAGLQRNLLFFGFGESGPDRGKAIYERFASLRHQLAPESEGAAPDWRDVFNPEYLRKVLEGFPDLARADPTLPTFQVSDPGAPRELTFHVSFESKSAVLGPGSDVTLFGVLAEIIRSGDSSFEIHGHTDSSGSANDNLELSRRRSEAVYEWLKSKLGADFRVHLVPHGESEPAVDDVVDGVPVPDLMARNRRVVLKIFPKKATNPEE